MTYFLILDLKHSAISVQSMHYLVMECVFISPCIVLVVIVQCASLKIRTITMRKSKTAIITNKLIIILSKTSGILRLKNVVVFSRVLNKIYVIQK